MDDLMKISSGIIETMESEDISEAFDMCVQKYNNIFKYVSYGGYRGLVRILFKIEDIGDKEARILYIYLKINYILLRGDRIEL